MEEQILIYTGLLYNQKLQEIKTQLKTDYLKISKEKLKFQHNYSFGHQIQFSDLFGVVQRAIRQISKKN